MALNMPRSCWSHCKLADQFYGGSSNERVFYKSQGSLRVKIYLYAEVAESSAILFHLLGLMSMVLYNYSSSFHRKRGLSPTPSEYCRTKHNSNEGSRVSMFQNIFHLSSVTSAKFHSPWSKYDWARMIQNAPTQRSYSQLL